MGGKKGGGGIGYRLERATVVDVVEDGWKLVSGNGGKWRERERIWREKNVVGRMLSVI